MDKTLKRALCDEGQPGKPGVGVIEPRFTVTLAERRAGAMPRRLGFGRLPMRPTASEMRRWGAEP